MHPLGMSVTLALPYNQAAARTREALKSEGFGVITEIDVRKTMKEKLGAEFRPYVIFGACNPSLAHRVLSAEPEMGLLLPCNVVVYEASGGTRVSAIDPTVRLGDSENPELRAVAQEVRARLQRVIKLLGN